MAPIVPYENAVVQEDELEQRRADFCWLIVGLVFGTLLDVWLAWLVIPLQRIGSIGIRDAIASLMFIAIFCAFGITQGIVVILRGALPNRTLAVICTSINLLPLLAWGACMVVAMA